MVIKVIFKGMIIGIKFIIKINKVSLIIPKKRNIKNNKQDINGLDKLLLKTITASRYKLSIFLVN